mgnify:CR=1 FL=1
MIKRPDIFARRLKYIYPLKRKIKFEFNKKIYESSIGFNNKTNFNEFIQNFFEENHKDLQAENYEIIRGDKFIEKSNLITESSLKETFKIIPMEISKNEIFKKKKLNKNKFNRGFDFSGFYEKDFSTHTNFFLYLSNVLEKKRYEIPENFMENKEKTINTSYNAPLDKELNSLFYTVMKNIPNSGYEQMNKFTFGVHDKDYYKQFNFSLMNYLIELNKPNMASSSNPNNDLNVDIDFNLTGFMAPEKQIDLMVRKLDNSFLLPITFANHSDDILNYKKYMLQNNFYKKFLNVKKNKIIRNVSERVKNFNGNLGNKNK